MNLLASIFPTQQRWLVPAAGFTLLMLAGLGHAQAATCRVTADGSASNDGSTWALAMDLTTALATTSCDEIWVKRGTYHPGASPLGYWTIDRNLGLYGGFAGTETTRDARDPAAYPTILSGDLPNSASNSSRLVFIVATNGTQINEQTVIDGFTITDVVGGSPGFNALVIIANGSGSVASPQVRQVTFAGNSGEYGGAVFIRAASSGVAEPEFSNTTFRDNEGRFGGAVAADDNGGVTRPFFYNCTFTGNKAGRMASGDDPAEVGFGGAIFVGDASLRLLHVTITGNEAGTSGGALQFDGVQGLPPDLTNVIVWGNTATNGTQIQGPVGSTVISHSVIQGAFAGGSWDSALGADGGGNTDFDPVLGLPGNHGGATDTILLGTGSSALDAGDGQCLSAGGLQVDQRGMPRAQGGACDIGAVEMGRPTAVVIQSVTGPGQVSAATSALLLDGIIDACDGSDPSVCHANYAEQAQVQLVAQPQPQAVFVGWSGDCSGTSPYFILTVDGDKACAAQFVANPAAELEVSVDDGRDITRAGELLSYGILVSNTGGTATTADVGSQFPASLDMASAHWQCLPTADVTCAATGNGPLLDSAFLPAGGSAFYVLSVAVNASGDDLIQAMVSATDSQGSVAGSDDTVRVLFRNGFEADGMGVTRPAVAVASLDALEQSGRDTVRVDYAMPAMRITTVARGLAGALQVQAVRAGARIWLRLYARGGGGAQASAWSELLAGQATVAVRSDAAGRRQIVLSGTRADLTLPLP